MEERFVEMCNDIYRKGMLDYESTCEKIVMSLDISDDEKCRIQSILDKAQEIFEESKGKKKVDFLISRKGYIMKNIKECPYYAEHGYCYDCPYYGDGDDDELAHSDCGYSAENLNNLKKGGE